MAYESGLVTVVEDRWNEDYFHPLGLQIRIEPPGVGKVIDMDVTSTKLFKYQQKIGITSPAPGVASNRGDKKEHRYQSKEGRYRVKAVHKARIVILPFTRLVPTQPSMPDLEGHRGQTEGITTGAHSSMEDLTPLIQRQSGPEGLDRTPNSAQRQTLAHQTRLSSEGLYGDRLEGEAKHPRSPARAPTTHWGGNR